MSFHNVLLGLFFEDVEIFYVSLNAGSSSFQTSISLLRRVYFA